MKWTFRAIVAAVGIASEAQRNEPGINQVDNCGPACVACLMMLHGYGDIEPQDLVGANYRGGTIGPQLNAIIAARYPNAPTMSWQPSVTDPIASLTAWASKGWLSMGLFYSDGAAVIKPYPTPILHWAMPVEDDDSGITVWNPEWATFDHFSYADFLKASIHQFDVCQRAIGGFMLNDKALFGLGHLIVSTMYHRPATAAEVQALGLKADLSNLDEVVQIVENNVKNPSADVYKLQATTLRKDLDAVTTPTGFAPKVHPHKVTATGEAVQ